MEEIKCKGGGAITGVYLVEMSDLKKTTDGKLKFKRKYGKFKREVQHISSIKA